MIARDIDLLVILSVYLGIENLEENRQQSAQQEKICGKSMQKLDMYKS